MLNDMMLEVNSGAIQSVHWDAENLELRLLFNSGGLYLYRDVGPDDLAKLLFTGSVGRAFLEHIKDRFDYERID
jgi:hypothetical protein